MILKLLIISCILNLCLGFTCFGIPSPSFSACSGRGLCTSQDVCNCFSGSSGVNCQIIAPTSCFTLGPPDPLATNWPPTLNNTFFANDTLHFEVLMPIVVGRLYTKISIQGSTNMNCTFPGLYWVNVVDPVSCVNRYIYNAPFSIARTCGWNVTNVIGGTGNITEQTFRGTILVTYKEEIDINEKKRVLRVVTSGLNLELFFNATNGGIPIIGPGSPIAAITLVKYILGERVIIKKQELVQTSDDSGLLQIFTSQTNPFFYSSATLITIPTGLSTPGIIYIPELSQCTPNTTLCNQVWEIPLVIGSACSFSGIYSVNFTQLCFNGCGIGPTFISFDFFVETTDFCTERALQINLVGSLTSYNNALFNTPTTSFVVGNTAFFRVNVNSNNAIILETRIRKVFLSTAGESKLLFDLGTTQAGQLRNYMKIPSNDTHSQLFKFDLTYLQLLQSPTLFTVTVRVQVRYISFTPEGTMAIGTEEHNLVQNSRRFHDAQTPFQTDIEIDPETSNPNSSNTLTISHWWIFSSLIFILSMF